jgi:outer membrane receptor protein involved in Fe transport
MRKSSNSTDRRHATLALLATTFLCAPAFAQDAPTAATTAPAAPQSAAPAANEEEIVVTATKRSENLQDVPIAITAIGTKALEDTQVDSFDDYAKAIPSLSYKSAGPGYSNVYFRGVASGENANHSTSLPSVGTYLDEQPITTITGALDLHIFDIARVEALAGPQGTLYGASSEAGTIRIITNKPDLNGVYGAVNLEANSVAHGDFGYTGEGFVNLPISSNMAARIVGWYRHDAGYIDNIHGTLPLSASGFTLDNADLVEDNYNDVDTYGARAALKIDLNDDWTITPALMAQRQVSHGSFAEESDLGHLKTMQFNPERNADKWYQAALTVEGKIGSFDMTYAGSYMQRRIEAVSDYSDYAYFYDNVFGSTFYDDFDNTISPNQRTESDDRFTKMSHELRFTSPADRRLRMVAGLFYQRQTHNIEQHYIIDDLADAITVPGTVDNIWLTKQLRVDRDYAAFGELSFDITPKLTVTGGGRLYKFDNSLKGFFGFNENWFDPGTGTCFGPAVLSGSPCTNVDKRTKATDFVHRLNLTYKPNEDLLLYATWSKGFRPGGVNRRGTLPPYMADFLTNYELGGKFSFGRGSHFNVTAYREDWSDIQLSFLGQNGLTEVRNAGEARIWGLEADLLLRPATGLTWSTGVAYNNAKILHDFCKIANDDFDCALGADLDGSGIIGDDPDEINETLADKGTRLPLTARLKANTRLRYEWELNNGMKANVQGVITYEGKRRRDLRDFENGIYGNMKSYTLVDASAGLDRGPWNVELYVKNLFDARGQLSKSIQCLESTCGDPGGDTARGGIIYTTVTRPRTTGLRVGRKF